MPSRVAGLGLNIDSEMSTGAGVDTATALSAADSGTASSEACSGTALYTVCLAISVVPAALSPLTLGWLEQTGEFFFLEQTLLRLAGLRAMLPAGLRVLAL